MGRPYRALVLGGGVSGLTTAILLRLHGIEARIVTERRLDRVHHSSVPERPPEIASLHAAASVVPHAVRVPEDLDAGLMGISQQFFRLLAFNASCGVRLQRHYELFELEPELPSYAANVFDFKKIDPSDPGGSGLPCRTGVQHLQGWTFRTHFLEVPTYLAFLHRLFEWQGGVIEIRKMNLEEFLHADADILVNCTGIGSRELFPEDTRETCIIRGHLVKVDIHRIPLDQGGQFFSYKYTPSRDVYPKPGRPDETIAEARARWPAHVYFYPRSDGWILGGSRETGEPDAYGNWRGQETLTDTVRLAHWEAEVPGPVWTLNRTLLFNLTGVDIADYPSQAFIGYRFGRRALRLASDDRCAGMGKLLIHNYGNGGAGYALSWGCAHEVQRIIERTIECSPQWPAAEASADCGAEASAALLLGDLCRRQWLDRAQEPRSAQWLAKSPAR